MILNKYENFRICVFDAKAHDRKYFSEANKEYNFDIRYFECALSEETAELAKDSDAICIFVNDICDTRVLDIAHELGIKLILLRCAGFDRVDLEAADALDISVARVPAYSPQAVAEFAVTLLMTLNRKTHLAFNRVRDGDFTLRGFEGFDLYGKTVGVVGTGRIGQCFINIMIGFGCKVLAYDKNKQVAAKPEVTYVEMPELLANSDVISLHIPLLESTKYLIRKETLDQMKPNCILVNTSRGGLVNTADLVDALKSKQIKGAALDVYEEEEQYFFEDRSEEIILDDTLARLLNMSNVMITSHQAFFTSDALTAIAKTTLSNAAEYSSGSRKTQLTNHIVCPEAVRRPSEEHLALRCMASGTVRASIIRRGSRTSDR